MIRYEAELDKSTVQGRFGGKGELSCIQLLNADAFHGKGRLFARNLLKPGCSIGIHTHEGDFEVYYILSGQGDYNDNGTIRPVCAGDVAVCPAGRFHALENTGRDDLDFMALILFTE